MSDLRDELMRIREDYGALTPASVVEAATPMDSPLHHHFEWDDSEAAHQYRLDQARRLIRVVREPFVRPNGEIARVRTFHSVPNGDGMAYSPLEEVIADPVATEIVLRQAEREWRAMWRRYAHLREFVDLVRNSVSVDEPVPNDNHSHV